MVDTKTLTDLYVAGRLPVDQDTGDRVSVARAVDFSVAASYELDFSTVNQQRVFGNIKSMFCDNSDNPNEIIVSVSTTGQRFTIPAFAEGYFSIIAAQNSRVKVDCAGGATALVTLTFHNWFIAPQVWYKYGMNPNDGVNSVQGTNPDGTDLATALDSNPVLVAGVDRATDLLHTIAVEADGSINANITTSGGTIDVDVQNFPAGFNVNNFPTGFDCNNIPAVNGGYNDISIAALTGASEVLAAANPNRRVLVISNVSANNIGINLSGGAASIGAAGTITILPGNNLTIDQFAPTNGVTVIGTAADVVTAYEG